MSFENAHFKARALTAIAAGGLALVLLALYLAMPEGASPEYRYTLEIIFGLCFIPLVLLALLAGHIIKKLARIPWLARHNALATGILGLALAAIPLLSPPVLQLAPFWKSMLSLCWILSCFSLALCAFFLAAKLSGIFPGLLCLLGSIILFFGLAEFFFLATDQFQDSYVQENGKSKYVLNNTAQAELPIKKEDGRLAPLKPEHPSGAAAHRETFKGKPLFDVRYIFADDNRRRMPPVSAKPGADILLFGCSYTFGHGLENEQTWAWRLSQDLGPDWKITNYAFNGYGAQQMLDLLEQNGIEPPNAPFRQAFFLAIRHQLHRASGLFDMYSSRYVWRNGKAVRDGLTIDSPWYALHSAQRFFNGSQAVREICSRLANRVRGLKHDEFLRIHVSMLEQAAKILKDKYATPLTVLVWPDFDELLPELAKKGIAAISMRGMLPAWTDPDGENYHIVKNNEYHPNERATRDIAAWLAAWLRKARAERAEISR